MRKALIGLLTGLVLAGPGAAQDGAGIEEVIRRQMDAFLAGDVDTAFSFASPGIQGAFRTPENFGRMVEEGYPMVWRPGEVRFGALVEEDGALWQRVIVRDGTGTMHALAYRMEQVDGAWRISGVKFVPLPEVSV